MYAFFMGIKSLSPQQLNQMLAEENVFVFDMNSLQNWSQAHVPGSVNLQAKSYVEGDLPADKNATLVFYCSNYLCKKAPLAAQRAKGMGFKNVMVMSAGIVGWMNSKFLTEASLKVG